MIGKPRFSYTDSDLRSLIRKDIIEKLGQRELSGIELNMPELYSSKAILTEITSDPIVKIKTIQDQIEEIHYPSKPALVRSGYTISVETTDAGVTSTLSDQKDNLIIAGGPVTFKSTQGDNTFASGFWIPIKLGFPLGITLDQGSVIPYTQDNEPKFLVIDEEASTSKEITLFINGLYSDSLLSINWNTLNQAETILVTNNAYLEDSTIEKYPVRPTQPIISISYNEFGEFSPAEIKIDVDLQAGK